VTVTVLTGPSGVGKGTVVTRLIQQHPEIWLSVSVTTRSPRPGEVDGVNYWFISDAEFDALVASGDLLEWALVHEVHRYGTPRQPVLKALREGRTCLLELDLAGARRVRQTMPEARTVFLMPPSRQELERRLRGRGTETEADLARRFRTADEELTAASEFDEIIVNSDVANTCEELVGFMGLSPGASAGHTTPIEGS
jgi:guanylate kinase